MYALSSTRYAGAPSRREPNGRFAPEGGEMEFVCGREIVGNLGAVRPPLTHCVGAPPHGEPNGRFAPEGGGMEFVRRGEKDKILE